MTIKQIKIVAEKNYGDGLLIKIGNKVLGTYTSRDTFAWVNKSSGMVGYGCLSVHPIVRKGVAEAFETFLRKHDLRDGLIIKNITEFEYDRDIEDLRFAI